MTARRAVHIILVLNIGLAHCVIPAAAKAGPQADPPEPSARARFEAGEEIEITGYMRHSDGYRIWKGRVQFAPPDSVTFTPPGTTRRPGFNLSMSDLAFIDLRGSDTSLVLSSARQGSVAALLSQELDSAQVSVVTTSSQGGSERSNQRALTIGVFVAIVGAVAIGYVVAGQ